MLGRLPAAREYLALLKLPQWHYLTTATATSCARASPHTENVWSSRWWRLRSADYLRPSGMGIRHLFVSYQHDTRPVSDSFSPAQNCGRIQITRSPRHSLPRRPPTSAPRPGMTRAASIRRATFECRVCFVFRGLRHTSCGWLSVFKVGK